MPEIVGRARMPRLASPPANPQQGEMYFNTADNKLYWWDGTAWVVATGGVGAIYDTDQIGTVKSFSGTVIPTNWMLADGRTLNRVDYPQLADAMGISAGATTFQLPDLRRRFIYGKNTPSEAMSSGGEETHVLTQAEMPVHQHAGTTGAADRSLDHLHTGPGGYNQFYYGTAGPNWYNYAGGGAVVTAYNYTGAMDRSIDHLHGFTTDNRGSGAAHNTLPPYVLLAWIIKVTGVQIDSGGALRGADGKSFEVYEQAAEPVTGTLGALWIDTDDIPQSYAYPIALAGGAFPNGPWPKDVIFSVPTKSDILLVVGGTVYSTTVAVGGLRVRWDAADLPVSAMQFFNEANSHKLVQAINIVRGVLPGNHTLTFGPYASGNMSSDSNDTASYGATMVAVP